MSKHFRKYLITYDIRDNKRRNKVASILEGYGERIQYSVFECYINNERLANIIRRLKQYVNAEEDDNVRIYPIDSIPPGEIIEIGKKKEKDAKRLIII